MAFFHSFTDSIKQKWLQFFQANHDWITLHMQVESVYTPDGGKRPPSYLILGVVNALEPKLAQLMLPFSKLNPDADTLIEVLDLHFDPNIALGNSVIPKLEAENGDEAVIRIEKHHEEQVSYSQTNGFGHHELEMVDSHEETLMVPNTVVQDELSQMSTQNGFGNGSVSDSQEKPSFDAADEFGDISFDDIKDSDSKIAPASAEKNKFDEAMDVWGDESASNNGEADNDIFAGEELSNGFDDSEIARLFPNA